MDTFFSYLKKCLVFTTLLLFAFVFTYTPVPYTDNVQEAVAVAGVGDVVLDPTNLVQTTATAVATVATQINTFNMAAKEMLGDGAAWLIAKGLVSALVRDITNWVQSGFEGKPMFVADINGFLTDTADKEFGAYLEELGGIGSVLCSPFSLDIRIALNLSYARSEEEVACTITDVIANVEGFTSGAKGSFLEGGWNDWFDLTSNPSQYTKTGQFMEAENEMYARIEGAKDLESRALDRSDGFRNVKECKQVPTGKGATKEVCEVTTPGKMISNAISDNIDSGREALITADEISELIGTLIGQVANKAFTGAGGFLNS